MIEYEVSPARSEYVSGEEVQITVRIANRRAVPIEVPDPEMRASVQPVHRLTGPARAEGVAFTNCRVLPDGSAQAAAGQKLIAIQPGATWTGQFSLNSLTDVSTPGEYRLTSKLEWEDVQAESKESNFRVEPLRLSSVHIGLGTRPLEAAEGGGAFIQRGDGSSQIYSFTFKEMRPAIGEAQVDTPIRRFAAGANATDIAVPWRRAPFFNEMLKWIVWREGRSVKALSDAAERPVSLDLPADLARLVLPPLKATDGPVEVLAVSRDGTRLFLAEFTGQMGEEGSAKLVWSGALPERPAGITAALASDAAGSYRHVAFVAERPQGFEIFHGQYKPGGPPPSFRSVRIGTGRLLPGAEPALFVEPDGRARVGVLALAAGDKPAAELVEAVFGEGAVEEPRPVRLGELPGKPTGGALLYADKQGALTRRDAVIAVEGNRLLKMDADRKLIPVTPGTPTNPILLAPGKQTSYILCIDPARGLYMEAL